jgi:hypothetical protein
LNGGATTFEWNGLSDNHTAVPSGVYFYEIKSEVYTSRRKMLLLK